MSYRSDRATTDLIWAGSGQRGLRRVDLRSKLDLGPTSCTKFIESSMTSGLIFRGRQPNRGYRGSGRFRSKSPHLLLESQATNPGSGTRFKSADGPVCAHSDFHTLLKREGRPCEAASETGGRFRLNSLHSCPRPKQRIQGLAHAPHRRTAPFVPVQVHTS